MPKFKRKPGVVEATRLTQEMLINTDAGQVFANPGDWLVTGVDKEQYPVKHNRFVQLYRPLDADAKDYFKEMSALEFEEEE